MDKTFESYVLRGRTRERWKDTLCRKKVRRRICHHQVYVSDIRLRVTSTLAILLKEHPGVYYIYMMMYIQPKSLGWVDVITFQPHIETRNPYNMETILNKVKKLNTYIKSCLKNYIVKITICFFLQNCKHYISSYHFYTTSFERCRYM